MDYNPRFSRASLNWEVACLFDQVFRFYLAQIENQNKYNFIHTCIYLFKTVFF